MNHRSKELPSVEYLHQCFGVNADGHLVWKERPLSHFGNARTRNMCNARRSGKIAGSLNNIGYLVVCLDRTKYLEHRLIYHMMVAPLSLDQCVDHINCDTSDNRLINLRVCSHAQNLMNQQGVRPRKYDAPKHVSWNPRENKFKVRMRANGRVHNVGTYSTLDEAIEAAKVARLELHGEFGNDGAARI